MKHKISCILPCYNRIGPLKDRLKELEIALSNFESEIIIVQDGKDIISQDEVNILYPKIKTKIITLKENSGSVSIPRNIGIDNSDGDIIAHIDDDVSCDQNKFFKLMTLDFLNDSSKKLCFGWRFERTVLPDSLRPSPSNPTRIPPQPQFSWNPLSSWGVDGGQFIYKRDVYDKFPYVFVRRACDWELAKQIAYHFSPESIICIKDFVCTYYWHDKNRSLDDSTKQKPIYPIKYKQYFKSDIVLPELV